MTASSTWPSGRVRVRPMGEVTPFDVKVKV